MQETGGMGSCLFGLDEGLAWHLPFHPEGMVTVAQQAEQLT
jgi:hypothetical protein